MFGFGDTGAICRLFLFCVEGIAVSVEPVSAEEKSQKICHGIGSWIVSTAHAFRRALECELSQQGVTFRQWEVMAWLNCDGEQPQNELAEKLGLEAQTLAGIISRMERDGWLTRQSCNEDRRRKLITATPKAQEIWNEMHACCEKIKQQAMQGLADNELQLLESMCERIRTNLETECPEMFNERQELLNNCVSKVVDDQPAVGDETHVNLEDTQCS